MHNDHASLRDCSQTMNVRCGLSLQPPSYVACILILSGQSFLERELSEPPFPMFLASHLRHGFRSNHNSHTVVFQSQTHSTRAKIGPGCRSMFWQFRNYSTSSIHDSAGVVKLPLTLELKRRKGRSGRDSSEHMGTLRSWTRCKRCPTPSTSQTHRHLLPGFSRRLPALFHREHAHTFLLFPLQIGRKPPCFMH